MLTGPAVDHDGLVGRQVREHRIAVQAGVGRELVGAGDVARNAGGAGAEVIRFPEVVDDEVVVQSVGDHLGVADALETVIEHLLHARRDTGLRVVIPQFGIGVHGQAAVVVGRLGRRQQVVDAVVPRARQAGVPAAHAEEQGLRVVAHQLQRDHGVAGALAAVAGHHEFLVDGDRRAHVAQQRAQRAVVGARNVPGVVGVQAADVDHRVGLVDQFGGQHVGADRAHGQRAVVHHGLDGVGDGREDIAHDVIVVLVGTTDNSQQGDQQQRPADSSHFHEFTPRPSRLRKTTSS